MGGAKLIRAGIDPGSAALGLAIADERRLLLLDVRDIGEQVLLTKPVRITRRDGSTIERTHRRTLEIAGVDRLVAGVVETLCEYHVTRLLLEWTDSVHIPRDSSGAASSMGTALVRTGIVAASIRCAARAVGIAVEIVSTQRWRGRVARYAGAKGREIVPGLAEQYENWPARSRDHEQDAAGVLLWDMLTDAPKRARAAAPMVTRACACAGRGRHRRGCALAAAAKPIIYQGREIAR